jgi:hypothetical protein
MEGTRCVLADALRGDLIEVVRRKQCHMALAAQKALFDRDQNVV